jgi:hypothetical protein
MADPTVAKRTGPGAWTRRCPSLWSRLYRRHHQPMLGHADRPRSSARPTSPATRRRESAARQSRGAPEATNNCGATVNVVVRAVLRLALRAGTTNVTCTATDSQATRPTAVSMSPSLSRPAATSPSPAAPNGSTTSARAGSVILTAANGMKSYLWSGPEQNGATVRTIVVGTAGTYYCTQQQYYGSTNCCSVTMVVNPPPNATITGNLVITNGLPTTLVGPSGMASQYWTGPQNNGLGSQSNTVIDRGHVHAVCHRQQRLPEHRLRDGPEQDARSVQHHGLGRRGRSDDLPGTHVDPDRGQRDVQLPLERSRTERRHSQVHSGGNPGHVHGAAD